MLKHTGIEFVNDHDPEGDALSAVVRAIDDYAASLRNLACAPASPFEAASWSLKIAEAKAGGGAMLSTEAAARGVTLEAMVARVLGNAGALGALEATISGVAGKHKDAARLLTEREEILAYDWREGWPDLTHLIR